MELQFSDYDFRRAYCILKIHSTGEIEYEGSALLFSRVQSTDFARCCVHDIILS